MATEWLPDIRIPFSRNKTRCGGVGDLVLHVYYSIDTYNKGGDDNLYVYCPSFHTYGIAHLSYKSPNPH